MCAIERRVKQPSVFRARARERPRRHGYNIHTSYLWTAWLLSPREAVSIHPLSWRHFFFLAVVIVRFPPSLSHPPHIESARAQQRVLIGTLSSGHDMRTSETRAHTNRSLCNLDNESERRPERCVFFLFFVFLFFCRKKPLMKDVDCTREEAVRGGRGGGGWEATGGSTLGL